MNVHPYAGRPTLLEQILCLSKAKNLKNVSGKAMIFRIATVAPLMFFVGTRPGGPA